MTTPLRTLRSVISLSGALALLVTLVSVFLPLSLAEAAGGTAVGNDISWPQCGSSFPVSQDFGIVGVNGGVPDDANSCLSSELSWAINSSLGTSSQPKASLYVNAADPGNVLNGVLVSDWPTSGNTPDGPCATTTVTANTGSATAGDDTPACAWLYGAQRGNQDMAWLSGASGPGISGTPNAYPWWLDVETGNTWQGGPAGQAMNVAVLQGMVASLAVGGAATIGLYSTSLQWGQITGGGAPGNLSGLPAWLPGAIDQPSAEANCFATSFTGGPVLLTQWTTTFDNDVACGSVVIGPVPTQIYGNDAIDTNIAISQREFGAGSASAVVLARSDFFSDALAGGPLAATNHGPLLITPGGPQSTLDPRVQSEIQRVLPAGRTVYVLGGDLALGPGIDATLSGLGYHVVREAGANEYATAVDVAGAFNPGTVFLATGLSFYDALSSVPAAISRGAAILLTNGNQEAPETAAYLAQHPSDAVYAIGGPLAAAGADPGATAVFGQDLFGTSAAIANTFFGSAAVYGAATDLDFADALGGGVFMATGGRSGPLLMVDSNTSSLSPSVSQYLALLAPNTPGYVFGGPLAVPPAVVAALALAVG